ncbi:phosphoribosyltransferase [Roseibium sp.]|uniref:phosphoribosyltransferase n=1 Tax=Roseibium sp. TaxID=1936156 RepID=UPI0039EEE3B3
MGVEGNIHPQRRKAHIQHSRVPWNKRDPSHVWASTRWERLKGVFQRSGREKDQYVETYQRAKTKFSSEDAEKLVFELFDERVLDRLVDCLLLADKPCVVVFPHPEFDSGEHDDKEFNLTNAIPFVLARYVAEQLGGHVNKSIIEVARPGRTKLSRMARFLWQPQFVGVVRDDVCYILVDDVYTTGGTLASLRSYIVENGGTVIAACVLSSHDGKEKLFPINQETVKSIYEIYGRELAQEWKREICYEIETLTNDEGLFLVNWSGTDRTRNISPLQRFRAKIAETKATGG